MRLVGLSILCLVAGCADPSDDGEPGPGPEPEPEPGTVTDPLAGLPSGAEQWALLCAKGHGDMITRAFCAGGTPPAISSLEDLRDLIGFTIVPGGDNPHLRATMLAHSTAISGRFVTELNPRVFVMTPPSDDGGRNAEYQVLAFARGEPFVELVANDPTADTIRFFLVRFHPACESTAAGCNFADLLTPTIESSWTGYTIYDDDTIKNTTLDCLQCHQPGGPGTPKMMRMQELRQPWHHWFYDDDFVVNRGHIQSFIDAHGSAPYGGVPLGLLSTGPSPQNLQRLIENNGFANQPNVFESAPIRVELEATGASPTWDAIYARAVAGDEIAVPYVDTPHTDPAAVAVAAAAYRDTISGAMPREQMPDIRDTVLDGALADLSIRPAPGLDGRGIMTHICRHCHNSRLDQSISRSRFNVDLLDTLSRYEKDKAIARLELPDHDARKMPPPRFHTLSDAERQLVIDELQR